MRTTSAMSLALVLTFTAAASARAQAARPKPKANEISAAELSDPIVKELTALKAIQRLRPNWLRSRGAADFGGPMSGSERTPSCGRGSTSCSAVGENAAGNVPGLIVNGVAQDADMMNQIKAGDLASAVFLSASDATTRYGTGYPNGAILLTMNALSR
jgi:hypothetical protein